MINYKCESIKDFTGNITSIIIFGLVCTVIPYTEQKAANAKKHNMQHYCNAIDKEGNKYKIFTNYDPCLEVSYRIAFIENK